MKPPLNPPPLMAKRLMVETDYYKAPSHAGAGALVRPAEQRSALPLQCKHVPRFLVWPNFCPGPIFRNLLLGYLIGRSTAIHSAESQSSFLGGLGSRCPFSKPTSRLLGLGRVDCCASTDE